LELDPVFESSHPYRSPFATGLATSSGTGESRLRNVDARSIEVTAPALQRGAVLVGLGSVLIQGKINSPTPPKAISANRTAGRVFADGTFQVTVPVVPGENNILLAAWWNDSDFVPRFFTVVAQNDENIVQEGRRYAVLSANPPQDWVSNADISDALARLSARHILIVADSCYAGAFRNRGGIDPDPAAQTHVQFLEGANLRPSRNFLTSEANEPVADGGGNGHSIFVRALLDALAQEKKPFTAGEVFAKLQSAVGGNSKQIPQYFPMKKGHEGGEFIFVPESAN
jgi:hypothetical protein